MTDGGDGAVVDVAGADTGGSAGKDAFNGAGSGDDDAGNIAGSCNGVFIGKQLLDSAESKLAFSSAADKEEPYRLVEEVETKGE